VTNWIDAGPMAALGLLRLLERADAKPAVFVLLVLSPAVASVAVAALGRAMSMAHRTSVAERLGLRRPRRTASSSSRV